MLSMLVGMQRRALNQQGYIVVECYSELVSGASDLTQSRKTPYKSWAGDPRWQEAARSRDSLFWRNHVPSEGHHNTGILLGSNTLAVDIDVNDGQLASFIASECQRLMGNAPIRTRPTSGRCALVFRTSTLITQSELSLPSNVGKIEFRSGNRQLIAYGIHGDGSIHEWKPDLQVTPHASLPLVTSEQVSAFWNAMAAHFQVAPVPRPAAQKHPPGVQVVQPVLSPAPSAATRPATSEDNARYAAGTLQRLANELATAPKGTRNDLLFKHTACMANMVASGWIDHQPVRNAIYEACKANGLADENHVGAGKTFQSGWEKGLAEPRLDRTVPVEIDATKLMVGGKTAAEQMGSTEVAEAPRPFRRAIANPQAFPLDSLGPLAWPAWAIAEKIQCPPAIAALSVLGVASLAAQAHADVLMPRTNQAKPLSLFLVSIGESGERKSAADAEASRAVKEYEKHLSLAFDAEAQPYRNAKDAWESDRQNVLRNKNLSGVLKKSQLDALIEPHAPLTPILTCPEPTYEGLCQLFSTGHGALGLFSDEGGHFVGGHALSEETRLRTAAGLSALWDGSPIKRVRAAKDGSYVLPGRRLAMHLMMQPKVGSELLSDPMLKDQGLLSRILISYPQSTAGTRFGKESDPRAQGALDQFTAQVGAILKADKMAFQGSVTS